MSCCSKGRAIAPVESEFMDEARGGYLATRLLIQPVATNCRISALTRG